VQAALEQGTTGGGEEGRIVAARLESLSARERQVLDGLIAGNSNKTIAQALGISPRTVEVYRANLMAKMEAKSLSELIRMALRADIARLRGSPA
jgi:two-component system response regulator FixJ